MSFADGSPNLPRLADGGPITPGKPGSEDLTILQPGERVLPRDMEVTIHGPIYGGPSGMTELLVALAGDIEAQRRARRRRIVAATLLALIVGTLAALALTRPVSATEPDYGLVEIDTSCGAATFDFALHDSSDPHVGWQVWLDDQLVAEGDAEAPDRVHTVTVELPPLPGTAVFELRWDDEPVDRSYESETFETFCDEEQSGPTSPPPPAEGSAGALASGRPAGTLPPTDTARQTGARAVPPSSIVPLLLAFVVFGGALLVITRLLELRHGPDRDLEEPWDPRR